MNAAFAETRAGRRGDRQLRHGRARRVARAPARGGLQRRPRGDREHAHQPRHDPVGPRLRSDPSPLPPPGLSITEADARDRARLAAAAPAHPDRRRALPLHPPLRARARRRLRRGVLARLRRGGRLLPALPRARAAPRGRRRPLRLPPRRRARSAARARARQQANEDELNRRYPYYAKAVLEAATSETIPLARSLAAARLAVGELSVTIDGSCLGPTLTGTQVLALELAGALARRGDVRLRVTVPRSLGDRARAALDALGRRAHVARRGRRRHRAERHRPPALPGDDAARPAAARPRSAAASCSPSSTRSPTTTPPTSPTTSEWRGYRELTRQALAFAHRVVFCSPHARDDSLRRGPRRRRARRARARSASTTAWWSPTASRWRRRASRAGRSCSASAPTSCTRTTRSRSRCSSACARPTASTAGSCSPARTRRAAPPRREEAAWRAAHPQLAADVIALGECPEAQKAWLYRNAALVLYPTTFEGFGFIPFEAAEAGAPSLWADQSSMADLLPSEHAGIVPWDAEASAANAARLIADPQAREALVAAVRAAGAELTWDRTAEQLLARLPRRRDRAAARLGRAARVALRPRDVARRPGRLAQPRRPAGAARGLRPPGAQAHGVRRAAAAATARCTGRGGRRSNGG